MLISTKGRYALRLSLIHILLFHVRREFHIHDVGKALHHQSVDHLTKRLAPTPLGEVVNGLMMERFSDIVNVEFTADMEKQLDRVEEGQLYCCLLYTSRCV